MWNRRALEITGQLVVGDGLTSLLVPRAHMLLWRDALPSRSWRTLVQWFADHPGVTRAIGATEVVAGTWMMIKASRDLD